MRANRRDGERGRGGYRVLVMAGVAGLVIAAMVALWRDRARLAEDLIATSTVLDSIPTAATPFDDPGLDGWDSEVLSDAVASQWKQVQRWMSDPASVAPGVLAALSADSFEAGPIRPEHWELVRDEPPVRIDRGLPGASTPPAGSVYRGSAGFLEALQTWRRPFAQGADVRAEFKVVRFEDVGETIRTHQLVSVSGTGVDGPEEEHATWITSWTREPVPRLLALTAEALERTRMTSGRRLFSDCTEAVLKRSLTDDALLGRGLPHWYVRIPAHLGQSPLGYHGLAVGDVNGDRLDDVYLCNSGGIPNQLYVQNLDGSFDERAAESGVDWMDSTMSALFLDLDDDGDQDLVLGSTPTMLLENDGAGHFEGRMLLPGPAIPTSMAAADHDRDGDLDLFVCYSSNEAAIPYHDANNGPRNILWRNDGGWAFRDITNSVGLDQNGTRFSFAAAWEDIDNDGDQDLYVANDYGRNNLFLNEGGHFRDVAPEAGVEDISAGMSVTFGDADLDGWMDLYVSNMFSSAGNRITYQRNFNPLADGTQRAAFQRHARGNSLFRNAGTGGFEDVSVDAGVTMGRWAWSSLFVDLDNDRLQDLVVANGNLTNEDSRDL